jgi:hypothetical protein
MKTIFVVLSLLPALFLPACTAEQAYGSGQAWQRNQCARIPDKAEYDRCMGKADTSYDSYKRETGSERKQ